MKSLFLGLISLYQLCIGPFLGSCCRFVPSCSEYAHEALTKYGTLKGMWMTVKRMVKCGPWHPGGHDPLN